MDELTIAFKIESPPSWLPIGRTAENNWRTVEIDCSYWFNMSADGEVVLMYKPSCGMSPYPLLTEREGDNIIWRPKSGELVEGVGRLQAFFEVGTDVIGSSDMISCEVDSSLLGVEPGTDPGQTELPWALDIIEQIAELSGHYPKIIDGNLYIWDSTLNDWVEFEAGGSGGSETVIVTINDTTDPMTASMNSTEIKAAVDRGERVVIQYSGSEIPYFSQADTVSVFSAAIYHGTPTGVAILVTANGTATVTTTGLVQSVNGQTGAVTVKEPYYLTVTTENGVTSVDKTPAEINALSMAGYDVHARIPDVLGFVYDLCFVGYLASANLAALASEYSGKSISILVDATKAVEYSAIDFASWIDRIEVNVGNLELVKADKSEIPSLTGYATETWVEGKGYQTASDVQMAVSGKADKVPRVAMTAADEVVTLNPNTLYVFPEMASLAITLAAPADTAIANEYHFIFTSGATPTTLSIPATVNQPDGFTVDANMVYEVSILENNMTAMSWEVTA